MKNIILGCLIVLLISGCSAVNDNKDLGAPIGQVIKVEIKINDLGEMVVKDGFSVPINLGPLPMDLAFDRVIKDIRAKPFLFVLLSEDENGNITKNEYDFGQSFEINIERDLWVKRIEQLGNGSIIAYIDKMPNDEKAISPQATIPPEVCPQQTQSQNDPKIFIVLYFEKLLINKQFQIMWGHLTQKFIQANNPSGYDAYVRWWAAVERIDVTDVVVQYIKGNVSEVDVTMDFYMVDGAFVEGQTMHYLLFYDQNLQTWMFDNP